MRLFDCSCHFLLLFSFSFFFVAVAAAGGCLSGEAIYGIDDQVSTCMWRIWQFTELVSDITARKREISTLPK